MFPFTPFVADNPTINFDNSASSLMTFGQFFMLKQPQIFVETLALHPNIEEDDLNVITPPSHIFLQKYENLPFSPRFC